MRVFEKESRFRLSTIIHADQILVLSDGLVVRGRYTCILIRSFLRGGVFRRRHSDLLALKGIYAEMWDEQLKAANSEEKE